MVPLRLSGQCVQKLGQTFQFSLLASDGVRNLRADLLDGHCALIPVIKQLGLFPGGHVGAAALLADHDSQIHQDFHGFPGRFRGNVESRGDGGAGIDLLPHFIPALCDFLRHFHRDLLVAGLIYVGAVGPFLVDDSHSTFLTDNVYFLQDIIILRFSKWDVQ